MSDNIDPIEFAKWFVHDRRKKTNPELECKWFASDLMSELCANHPFESEHRLITEYKEYLKNETKVNKK